jgi:hypothetical protein
MTKHFGIRPPDLDHMTFAEISYYRQATEALVDDANRAAIDAQRPSRRGRRPIRRRRR